MTYLKQINGELQDFQHKNITIVPGLTFNQLDTIHRIHRYYNSTFENGEFDDEGDKKYFYNVVKNPCKVFTKAIDFDTKNIGLKTIDGGDPLVTWFMQRDLNYWMRENQFGRTLNRIFYELPIFGSVVLKIVKGKPQFVDLRNFVVEPSADSLDDTNYITEIHNFTVGGFRKAARVMGWDNVEEVIKEFRQMKGISHIRVLERYGELEDVDVSLDSKKRWTNRRVFIADVGVDEYDQRHELVAEHPGITLSDEEWEGHPYWEFHSEKMPGRWLGVGVVESLFEPQVRQNEIANLQAKGSYWAALRIFQTRDPAIARNLMTETKNGEILTVDSEITPVNMEERNLAFFNQETQKWLMNRDELTFSHDVVQGERLPAGTPLGSARLAIGQTLTYFEGIQENIALDIKEMLYEVILPSFKKDRSAKHTLRLVGEDLDVFVEMVKNRLVLQEMIRQMVNFKKMPRPEDKDVIEKAIVESIKQDKERLIDVPKNFYKNAKYEVEIDITGESVDTRVRYATRFAILQAVTADPTMLRDPVKKKILGGMAEDGGLNPADLFGVESEPDPMMQMMPQKGSGGGVSAPQAPTELMGEMSQTV